MKATIEAVITFEGMSALSATASAFSRKLLVFFMAFLMAKTTIIKAMAMMANMIDHITTRIIKAISRTVIDGIKYTVLCIKRSTISNY